MNVNQARRAVIMITNLLLGNVKPRRGEISEWDEMMLRSSNPLVENSNEKKPHHRECLQR